MPVFALYNFNDNTTVVDDAPINGVQNGIYLNGATAVGGNLVLDGCNDFAKIYPAPQFQMPRGTLEINFTPTSTHMKCAQTVLARDSLGQNQGSYRVEVNPDGSVHITHETEGGATSYNTGPGFYSPGDTINLTYSWDNGGTGGKMVLENQTTGGNYHADVPPELTMDMADQSQPWTVGAGQANSHPGQLDHIGSHFQGTVDFFSLSDTVDNCHTHEAPDANPDCAETPEDTPVVIDVLANDTDPNGDPLSIHGTPTAGHGTVSVNPDGTLTYTPDENYNGHDTITYMITDPDGNTATSTVAVTVTPVNDAPDAVDDLRSTPLDTAIIIPVLANDTDVDGDTLTVTGVGTSADGTVMLNPDGTVTFTPNTGFTGAATFTYDVSDGEGGTDTATVTVNVTGPGADGIVRGTAGADLIDNNYHDPFDSDRVDANDAIIWGDGPNDDRIIAGAGNDTIFSGLGNDTVIAGTGDDLVYGGEGNDDLRGNEGDDTLYGGNGRDTVYGQQGNDYIDTSGSSQPLPDAGYPGFYPSDTDPDNDRDLVFGGVGNDTILTGDDADTIYGDDGNDLIDAGFDDDSIFGGLGNDTIVGNEGDDTIEGGDGDDLIFGGLNDVIGDALDIPDDAGDLRPDNNRDLIYGGDGNDTIFGRDDDDTLYGGTGNDLLDGGVDDDVIFGDEGNDTIQGSQGNDSATGGDDRDVFLIGTQEQGIGDFIDGSEGGDDYDTLDLRGSGPMNIVYDPTNPENGTVTFLDGAGNPTGTLDFINIENVIPCFTPGTLIATPRGEVPVELLRAGDKVVTRDNGIQEIRWTGQKTLTGQDLRLNSHLNPVFVKRGALGNGLPEQDMMVSPNHRLLVANDRTQLYFDEHEVLVAAKHLVGTKGVHAVEAIGVEYIHFMFDRHEVVLSNGAWTESFQPGDYTLKGMGNAQRSEIFELFPELKSEDGLEGYTAARRTLKRHEARLLVR
ncbi:MAG: Hint domain-containing protein [Paracoccaceae bacterium]